MENQNAEAYKIALARAQELINKLDATLPSFDQADANMASWGRIADLNRLNDILEQAMEVLV